MNQDNQRSITIMTIQGDQSYGMTQCFVSTWCHLELLGRVSQHWRTFHTLIPIITNCTKIFRPTYSPNAISTEQSMKSAVSTCWSSPSRMSFDRRSRVFDSIAEDAHTSSNTILWQKNYNDYIIIIIIERI